MARRRRYRDEYYDDDGYEYEEEYDDDRPRRRKKSAATCFNCTCFIFAFIIFVTLAFVTIHIFGPGHKGVSLKQTNPIEDIKQDIADIIGSAKDKLTSDTDRVAAWIDNAQNIIEKRADKTLDRVISINDAIVTNTEKIRDLTMRTQEDLATLLETKKKFENVLLQLDRDREETSRALNLINTQIKAFTAPPAPDTAPPQAESTPK